MAFPPFLTITKQIGETPLQAAERLRTEHAIPPEVPLAYAGRLDPMATGALVVLIGEECKVQEKYHGLDKEYVFEVLLGATSDTGDVLGFVKKTDTEPTDEDISSVLSSFVGKITLPYPHFSSKTVKGKPLHVWTLEKRLDEIEIPTKESTIYKLDLESTYTITASDLIKRASAMINSIPKVTDPRKELGADFRRHDVRNTWQGLYYDGPDHVYTVHRIQCIASSGTYMRTLAEKIGERMGVGGLALSIHRTRIGTYHGIPGSLGFWRKTIAQAD